MPKIKCQAVKCLHNYDDFCDVTNDCQIDIDSNGNCIDYSEVNDEEYLLCTGRNRNLDGK